MRPVVAALVIAFSCVPLPAFTQPAGSMPSAEVRGAPALPSASGASNRPLATATKVSEAPALDGAVLGDATWQQAVVTDGFWQTTPDDGQPASERTEVRIVYTDATLYVGVVCYDRQPREILASDSRRDASLDSTDSFLFILDTFRDGQSGFVFGTNPAGIEYDGQVTREGDDGGGPGGSTLQQSGSGGGFNLNWDGAWEVRTKVADFGWSAEFAIPFRTLRYRPGDDTWRVNFQRVIRRRNERAYWASLDRRYNLFRLVDAGSLTGLSVPPQRNLKLSPYVLGSAIDQRNGPGEGDFDAGGDVKWSLSPSVTLDLTVNTDFAQVEVDEEQINLDRFNLFFPEKRPFFLENAGLFAVGKPEAVELFFSRRIGIADDGAVIPIRGGGRLTGKVGGLNVGLLNIQTARVGQVEPSDNFSVARLTQDLPNRSSVGVLFTSRTPTGRLSHLREDGQTYAVDARFGIGRRALVQGFASRTSGPAGGGREHAYSIGMQWQPSDYRIGSTYTEVGGEFQPLAGFLSRDDYRGIEASIFRTIRLDTNRFSLLELRPHTSYNGFWNFDGVNETGRWHIDNHWAWRGGHEVHTGMNVTHETVIAPFDIYPDVEVPAGHYNHVLGQLVAFTNQAAPVFAEWTLNAGGFFGGTRIGNQVGLTVRIGDTFNTSVSLNRNDVDLPVGSFVTNLVRTRVSYSFTPRLYLQALLQYNDRADIWSTNLRVGWLQSSNTGMFIVFNDTQNLDDLSTRPVGRSVIVKYSHLIDVLR